MVKVRGVMVYPAQIDIAIDGVEGVESEYQLHITRDATGHDQAVLRVEGEPSPSVAEALAEKLKRLVGLRFDVELVAPRSLPRTERKSQRVFDHR